MEEFERICKILINEGYRETSIEGATKRIFSNNDNKINITVEVDMDRISAEDEEVIIKRLIELGYL